MNRAQRQVLIAGTFVVVALLAVGFWPFTITTTASMDVGPVTAPALTRSETASCSAIVGNRTFETNGQPTFRLATCDAVDAWRAPILAGVAAAVAFTALGVLWAATPRRRAGSDDLAGSEGASDAPPLNPSSATPSPPR